MKILITHINPPLANLTIQTWRYTFESISVFMWNSMNVII